MAFLKRVTNNTPQLTKPHADNGLKTPAATALLLHRPHSRSSQTLYSDQTRSQTLYGVNLGTFNKLQVNYTRYEQKLNLNWENIYLNCNVNTYNIHISYYS